MNRSKPLLKQSNSQFLLYQTEDGQTRIEVRMEDETVWLTQKAMAELFQKSVATINEHIKNVFKEGELQEDSVIRKFRIAASDGKNYLTNFYNLDVIISVGYRVKSHRGTQFRIWATQKLKEYIIKGFVLDDERLKEGGTKNDYFEELLRRVRDIRASEKNFYRKVTDIYGTSIDYDPDIEITKEFFATVQNKFHWAIHGHTASELICERVNARKVNMGLTNWKGVKVRKEDIIVAKNYLTEEELEQLNLLVEQYLSFAELQAKQKKVMYMKDWVKKLHDFLTINEREILQDAGKISHELAKELAEKEYERFEGKRIKFEKDNPVSDFDKSVRRYRRGKKRKETDITDLSRSFDLPAPRLRQAGSPSTRLRRGSTEVTTK